MTEPFLLDNDRIKVKDNQNMLQDSMWQGVDFGPASTYSWWVEDFMTYVAGDWTVTETDAGATQALATSAPCADGVLLVTDTDADNNLVSMQKVGHSVVPAANKNIYYETRIQASEATQVDLIFGLVATDTAPVTSIAEGIIFRKDDGDTNIDVSSVSGSAASTITGLATFAANSYTKLGMKISGTSLVEFYINDYKVTEINTNIPIVPLRPTFTIQDGDTGAALGALTLSVDYIKIAETRI